MKVYCPYCYSEMQAQESKKYYKCPKCQHTVQLSYIDKGTDLFNSNVLKEEINPFDEEFNLELYLWYLK